MGVENVVNKGKYLVPRKRRIHTNLATCFAITALVKSLGHTFSVAFALSLTGVGVGAGAVQIPYLALTSRVSGPEGSRTRESGRPAAVPVFIFSNISLGLGAVFCLIWVGCFAEGRNLALIRLQPRRVRLALHAKLFVVVLGDVAVLPDASVRFLRSILGRMILIHLKHI